MRRGDGDGKSERASSLHLDERSGRPSVGADDVMLMLMALISSRRPLIWSIVSWIRGVREGVKASRLRRGRYGYGYVQPAGRWPQGDKVTCQRLRCGAVRCGDLLALAGACAVRIGAAVGERASVCSVCVQRRRLCLCLCAAGKRRGE